jgi:PAS domain-containing protein
MYKEAKRADRFLLMAMDDREYSDFKQRENIEGFRALYETMEEGVIYYEPDGRMVWANQAALRMIDLAPERIKEIGLSGSHLRAIHEDGSPFDLDEHPSIVALKTGEAVRNVVMGLFIPSTEIYRWIEITAIPLFLENESCPYVAFSVMNDITCRKSIEEALNSSEERISLAVKAADEGVWDWDLETNETFFSTRRKEMPGFYP